MHIHPNVAKLDRRTHKHLRPPYRERYCKVCVAHRAAIRKAKFRNTPVRQSISATLYTVLGIWGNSPTKTKHQTRSWSKPVRPIFAVPAETLVLVAETLERPCSPCEWEHVAFERDLCANVVGKPSTARLPLRIPNGAILA